MLDLPIKNNDTVPKQKVKSFMNCDFTAGFSQIRFFLSKTYSNFILWCFFSNIFIGGKKFHFKQHIPGVIFR